MTEQAVTETLETAPITTEPAKAEAAKAEPAKPGDRATIADAPADDSKVVTADWPADWRSKLSGGDEKVLKQMERYQSPQDVAKALREAQAKISAGLKGPAALPSDATEEQVAAFRKENGIPEKPEGYLEKLPDGLVIGDDDKPMVASFLAAAHAKNMKPDEVGAAIDWYYKAQDDAAAAQSEADTKFHKESADTLRAEWGAEYTQNVNAISAFLDAAPVEGDVSFKKLLLGARLADGTALGDNPLALRWLAGLANEANPAGFVAPAAGGNQIKSVKDEIKEIEDFMRTNRAEYNRDGAKQARLRQLYEAEEKLSKRA